jgi:hypothetical protein
VPGPLSKEALLVLVQGCLLVSRTLLTDYISRIEGYCGRSITSLVGAREKGGPRTRTPGQSVQRHGAGPVDAGRPCSGARDRRQWQAS